MARRPTTNDPDRSAPLGAGAFSGPARAGAARSRAGELHVCPGCHSELVYPIDWSPADRKRWSVDLRCPECEWHGGGVYAQEVVDRFDQALDRGTETLLADLALLARSNMEDQVEGFVEGLRAGWILPEDF